MLPIFIDTFSNLYLKSNNVKAAKEITSVSISQIDDILGRQTVLKNEFKINSSFQLSIMIR